MRRKWNSRELNAFKVWEGRFDRPYWWMLAAVIAFPSVHSCWGGDEMRYFSGRFPIPRCVVRSRNFVRWMLRRPQGRQGRPRRSRTSGPAR